jgi:hypothetical protein
MGQELACRVQYRDRTLSGKAYLETDFLLFRGEERLKIPFKDLTAVEVESGILRLQFNGSDAAFELGAKAAQWADKILHRPSRLDKLGVKPISAVALVGEFDTDFLAELRAREARFVSGRARADLVFLAAAGSSDLARIPKLIARLAPRGVLWVTYPRGVTAIREVEVIQAGRLAGLKDTKVVAFSAERTALRFSLPATR